MKSIHVRSLIAVACAAVALTFVACDPTSSTNPNEAISGNPPAGGPSSNGGGPANAMEADTSGLKGIMVVLAKGPNSLTTRLGQELANDPPPWDEMQQQTKEYVELVAKMPSLEPPKGTKESWAEQTAAFAKLSGELAAAVDAKNADSALAVHGQITKSCMGCHRSHRVMGPGGGPGGRPGGPGGPPPGGPGGGPPPGGMPPTAPGQG